MPKDDEEIITPPPRSKGCSLDIKTPIEKPKKKVVVPYAKIQLAAAKRSELAAKGKGKKSNAEPLHDSTLGLLFFLFVSVYIKRCICRNPLSTSCLGCTAVQVCKNFIPSAPRHELRNHSLLVAIRARTRRIPRLPRLPRLKL